MKKLMLLLSVCVLAALPASDTFVASDGTALTTHNANWYNPGDAVTILANAAECSVTFVYCYAAWTGDTFANDQYSEATLDYTDGSTYIGPMVRGSNSAATGYICICNSTDMALQRLSAGSLADSIDGYTGTFSPGDVIRLEITGTSIVCKQNGTIRISTTDATLSSGYAGMGFYNSTDPRIGTWSAGNMGGPRRRLVVIQ